MAKKVSVGVQIDGTAKGFKQAASQAEQHVQKLRRKVDKQNKGMTAGFKNLAKTIGLAFVVKKLLDFGNELVRIAAKAEGIRTAFNKLNAPGLLKNLQAATRHTVDNITLMQKAVQAKNFNIPLEQLATYFKFATNRAIETGESVQYLVDSIVAGIGRKSSLVLDNLGISLIDIQTELKITGDYGTAVGNIIARGLEEMGVVADTASVKIGRLATVWANLKENVGTWLINTKAFNDFVDGLEKFSNLIKPGVDIYGESKVTNQYAGKSKGQLDALKNRLLVDIDVVSSALAATELEYQKLLDGLSKIDKKFAERAWKRKSTIIATLPKEKALNEQIRLNKEYTKSLEGLKFKLQQLEVAYAQLPDPDEEVIVTPKTNETLGTLNEKLKEAKEYLNLINVSNIEAIRLQQAVIKSIEDRIEAIKNGESVENAAYKRLEEYTKLLEKADKYVPPSFAGRGIGQSGVNLLRFGYTGDQGLEEIGTEGLNWIYDLESAFAGFFRETEGGFESMAASFGRALQEMAAQLAAKAAIFAILTLLSGGSSAAASGISEMLKNFRWFAGGGIASGPTLGMVGEYPGAKHNPEVVAPLDKLKSMLGSGIGQSVQVEGIISGRDIKLVNRRM